MDTDRILPMNWNAMDMMPDIPLSDFSFPFDSIIVDAVRQNAASACYFPLRLEHRLCARYNSV